MTLKQYNTDTIRHLEVTLGVTFNGLQERVNGPSLYLFTCQQTGSTFGVPHLMDVEDAVEEMRLKFKGGAR